MIFALKEALTCIYLPGNPYIMFTSKRSPVFTFTLITSKRTLYLPLKEALCSSTSSCFCGLRVLRQLPVDGKPWNAVGNTDAVLERENMIVHKLC